MTVVDLYTVQIVEEERNPDARCTCRSVTGVCGKHTFRPPPTAEQSDALMAEAEENLTDLLPAGYRARIRRWNEPDPDEGDKDAVD